MFEYDGDDGPDRVLVAVRVVVRGCVCVHDGERVPERDWVGVWDAVCVMDDDRVELRVIDDVRVAEAEAVTVRVVEGVWVSERVGDASVAEGEADDEGGGDAGGVADGDAEGVGAADWDEDDDIDLHVTNSRRRLWQHAISEV